MSSERPDRTTMEGMIWNASHLLDQVLSPDTAGIPRDLFVQSKGVVLMSVIEAGFVFSGSVGTGVLIARKPDGTWSPPSALGLGGIGCGLVAGAEVKDIIVCVLDEEDLKAISSERQFKIGGQFSATAGPIGRETEVDFHLSQDGAGTSFTWSFSKGLLGGITLESAVLSVRKKENERFYGNCAKTHEILEGAIHYPKGKGIEELHHKLDLLNEGKTLVPTADQLEKKDSMRVEAEKAGLGAKASQTDVVEVDASSQQSSQQQK